MTKLKNYGIITGDTLNTSFGYDEENSKCKKLKELLLNLFLEKKTPILPVKECILLFNRCIWQKAM